MVRRETRSIVLVGMTGSGKSTAINAMFGAKFATGAGDSVTSKVAHARYATGATEAFDVTVFDTPGLHDTRKSGDAKVQEALAALGRSVAREVSGGHVWALLIVKSGSLRLTPEETDTISVLKHLFGDAALPNIALIETHASAVPVQERPRVEEADRAKLPWLHSIIWIESELESLAPFMRKPERIGDASPATARDKVLAFTRERERPFQVKEYQAEVAYSFYLAQKALREALEQRDGWPRALKAEVAAWIAAASKAAADESVAPAVFSDAHTPSSASPLGMVWSAIPPQQRKAVIAMLADDLKTLQVSLQDQCCSIA